MPTHRRRVPNDDPDLLDAAAFFKDLLMHASQNIWKFNAAAQNKKLCAEIGGWVRENVGWDTADEILRAEINKGKSIPTGLSELVWLLVEDKSFPDVNACVLGRANFGVIKTSDQLGICNGAEVWCDYSAQLLRWLVGQMFWRVRMLATRLVEKFEWAVKYPRLSQMALDKWKREIHASHLGARTTIFATVKRLLSAMKHELWLLEGFYLSSEKRNTATGSSLWYALQDDLHSQSAFWHCKVTVFHNKLYDVHPLPESQGVDVNGQGDSQTIMETQIDTQVLSDVFSRCHHFAQLESDSQVVIVKEVVSLLDNDSQAMGLEVSAVVRSDLNAAEQQIATCTVDHSACIMDSSRAQRVPPAATTSTIAQQAVDCVSGEGDMVFGKQDEDPESCQLVRCSYCSRVVDLDPDDDDDVKGIPTPMGKRPVSLMAVCVSDGAGNNKHEEASAPPLKRLKNCQHFYA